MKNKKQIIDYGMSAEMLDNVVYYSDMVINTDWVHQND